MLLREVLATQQICIDTTQPNMQVTRQSQENHITNSVVLQSLICFTADLQYFLDFNFQFLWHIVQPILEFCLFGLQSLYQPGLARRLLVQLWNLHCMLTILQRKTPARLAKTAMQLKFIILSISIEQNCYTDVKDLRWPIKLEVICTSQSQQYHH